MRHAQKISGVEKVHAIVGGFHLAPAHDEIVALRRDAAGPTREWRLALTPSPRRSGNPPELLIRVQWPRGIGPLRTMVARSQDGERSSMVRALDCGSRG